VVAVVHTIKETYVSDTQQQKLRIESKDLEAINNFLLNPDNKLVKDLTALVAKFGTPEQINEKARKARQLPNLLKRLDDMKSPYLADLKWLMEMRDTNAFVSISDFRRAAFDGGAEKVADNKSPVVLEISACQYFPWLINQARQAIARREIMPGRFIRVRNMAESAEDDGDLIAMMAAMEIVGASYVETLDTRGSDGSNVHLGGPDTILGYFGGVGQPNNYPLKWIEEFLHYYTEYGVTQVLTLEPGTMMLGHWLSRMGVDIEFKISVFAGVDNPWAFFYMLMVAKMFARPDGFTPVVGLNVSNSVNAETIRACARIRDELGMTDRVRIEHHITNAHDCVQPPYLRRDELLDVARDIKNICAKHEAGEPAVEASRRQPSRNQTYFQAKKDIVASGEMSLLELNYQDKHDSVMETAKSLTKAGLSFTAARNLHRA
jgi:hypothetical protein